MKARHVLPLLLAAFALAAHGGEKVIHDGDTLVFMGDSITQFGKDTVGVSGAKADRWYALEKTTDLAVDFAVDVATWTKGSDLLAGTGELSIALDENEPAAFYRVVESDVDPSL